MQESALLDAIERYIRAEMLPEEKAFFEHLRQTNPVIDQAVVEHTVFLDQFHQYGEIRNLKSQLGEIHTDLAGRGAIQEARPAKVMVLWKKYKRVVGVAASIAGITALGISGLMSYLSPSPPCLTGRLKGRRHLPIEAASLPSRPGIKPHPADQETPQFILYRNSCGLAELRTSFHRRT